MDALWPKRRRKVQARSKSRADLAGMMLGVKVFLLFYYIVRKWPSRSLAFVPVCADHWQNDAAILPTPRHDLPSDPVDNVAQFGSTFPVLAFLIGEQRSFAPCF
jgi:hypothetical protein